ncbi:CopM family metallochaperone [Microvirga roseola]|uniref:CopM family metallochaperone n=1 Tax=Microvirga roseola TaxID=2883126 RepID=UPI001E43CE7A|nr:DUF305 domain-containing protein [Microvirga roseola]
MRTFILSAALLALTGPALAQAPADHQQHHPGGTPAPQTQAQPQMPEQPQGQIPMGQMMQNMPEQCRAMMQSMPQNCMGMMQQMMQGGMMGQGMMHGQGSSMQGSSGQAAPRSEAAKAYMEAMDKMHGPMMEAALDPDPDIAFVKGMIPHHQSAIDMAQVVLKHGKDERAKKWANDVIREQEREIREMREWLKERGAQ